MKIYSGLYNNFSPLDEFFPNVATKVVRHPEEMDEPGILIIHGGEDISPSLYNKGRSSFSYARDSLSKRDVSEMNLIRGAKERNIAVFGICRGAQLLCAVAGGYLIQHVNNHFGKHPVTTYDGESFYVNSIHHQMQAPWKVPHTMLAQSAKPESDVYYDVDDPVQVPNEPEAVFYPELKGLAIQWHPEAMGVDTPANKWVKKQVMEKLL